MSKTIWVGVVAYDPKVVTIWEGLRSYFHDEAHLPVEVVLFQSYENQVLALEYRVSNRLSFVAQYEQGSLSNVTRNSNVFSFEVRLRKRF